MSAVREAAQTALDRLGQSLGAEVGDGELGADAWIIAPHPDDEVLGCGGTIARKVALGARVRVCFVTDGASSHAEWIAAGELRAMRKKEAQSACERLGVAPEHVLFLGFEDGKLAAHVDEAASELQAHLERDATAEIYAPHHREEPEDHRAACWIARTAMERSGLRGAYLEYPVWCWNEWPWVSGAEGRLSLRGAARSVRGLVRSLRLAEECRWRVPITEVHALKRHALEAHHTQMFGLDGVEHCPTLNDFAGGEFLARFFASHEVFERHETPPSASAVRLIRGTTDPLR